MKVLNIGSNAFSGLTVDLNFPASLKTLDINAFKNYKGSSISVKQENSTFGSKDGVLYSNDFKELYYVPTKLEVNDFKLLDSVEVMLLQKIVISILFILVKIVI